MKPFNPILACDIDLNKLDELPYPLAGFVKLDGVRVLLRNGFYGRSLNLHKNPYLQKVFDKPEYFGFDGEGIVGDPMAADCCTVTSGAFSRQKDSKKEPHKIIAVDAVVYVFDDFSYEGTYEERHFNAAHRIAALGDGHPIKLLEYTIINNPTELLAFEDKLMADAEAEGKECEGAIYRNLRGNYKHGRTTAREMNFLRLKRFEECEGEVLSVEEGSTNGNPAKINANGHTERSTAKENMIPNGMIASMMVRDLKTNEVVKVAAGRLTDAEAKVMFEDQTLIVSHLIKYKKFAKGTGAFSKPRFPTYQCHRSKEDMS